MDVRAKLKMSRIALALSVVAMAFSLWTSVRSMQEGNRARRNVAEITERCRQKAFVGLERLYIPDAGEKLEFRQRLGAAKDLDGLMVVMREADARSQANQVFATAMFRINELKERHKP